MSARKILLLLLTVCVVLGSSSESLAAKKKAKKSAPAGDAVAKILSQNKPDNPTNAQIIRNALKKYKADYVFIVTVTDDNWIIVEPVSAKNGAKKGRADILVSEKNMDNLLPLWNKMKGACIFEYSGISMNFWKANATGTNFQAVRLDDVENFDSLETMYNKIGIFVEDKFPFILRYLETGI